MKEGIMWVGLDTHKDSVTVALQAPGEKLVQWRQPMTNEAIAKLKKRLVKTGAGREIRCVYEAGPGGFWLKRELERKGEMVCEVVAPSLTPKKSGDRVKTDKRDAKKLVEMFEANMLTEVHPPTPEEEALRDLCRCREALVRSRQQARKRLLGFLLRHNRVYREGRNWARGHSRWLHALKFELPTHQIVFAEYLAMVELLDERVQSVEQQLLDVAAQPEHGELVGRLRCLHGIDTLSAISILAEVHNIGRFAHPRELMPYLGLVPSESSSGPRELRGRITKAGNGHARRVLVEASKHYRHACAVSPGLRERRKGQPAGVVAHAEKAHSRLSRRYRRLINRGKMHNVATVAVARELVGFIWAIMR
jgi:transposase